MVVIDARNVHEALLKGLHTLRTQGAERQSRNGPVLVMDGPVTTMYRHPRERVLQYPGRGENPFFHFYESLWMLGGRNDVASLTTMVPRMKEFSDNGKTFHGAYGHRWRKRLGMDQLAIIAKALRTNKDDRRCVLQMWDVANDLGQVGKDFPCNTQIYFSVSAHGTLDMTVCNRSNDIIWGAYGANAVHMSMLQEFMAAWVGVPVGIYWQMSNNYHAYREVFDKTWENVMEAPASGDCYSSGLISPFPLVNSDIESWQRDNEMFLDGVDVQFNDVFFRRVAVPIQRAHRHMKNVDLGEGRFEVARDIIQQCSASDWRMACERFITRSEQKWRKAQDDGPQHV